MTGRHLARRQVVWQCLTVTKNEVALCCTLRLLIKCLFKSALKTPTEGFAARDRSIPFRRVASLAAAPTPSQVQEERDALCVVLEHFKPRVSATSTSCRPTIQAPSPTREHALNTCSVIADAPTKACKRRGLRT